MEVCVTLYNRRLIKMANKHETVPERDFVVIYENNLFRDGIYTTAVFKRVVYLNVSSHVQ